MLPIDRKNTTHWAMSAIASSGAIVGVNFFDLVNLETGRAHGLIFPSGGINFGIGGQIGSEPSYTKFRTYRPVNFADFDGAGGVLKGASASFGGGIGYTSLIIGDTYGSGDLCSIQFKEAGFGLSLSVTAVAFGVMVVTYGYGRPRGVLNVGLHLEIKDEMPPDKRYTKIQFKPKEEGLIVPSDVLFDFDSFQLKPVAKEYLQKAKEILTRRNHKSVSIEGHTDSKGSIEYNRKLSLQRAQEIKKWLIQNKVPSAVDFRVVGWGESKPIDSNTLPNGSDNPEGRARNRRVEFCF